MKHRNYKLFTPALAATLATISTLSAATINFSGYTNGEIVGQDGWSDDTGYFSVTSGVVNQVAGSYSRGVERTFSDLEVGGSFDTTSSIVAYSFTFDPGARVDGQYTGMSFNVGGDIIDPAETEISLHVIPHGLFKIVDGVKTGNDEYFDGFSVSDRWADNTDVTVTLTLDYGNSTYTATRSDLPGATRTDLPFVKGTGGNGAYNIRLNANQFHNAPAIKSISVDLVPEPSSALLLGSAGLLGLLRRRRA